MPILDAVPWEALVFVVSLVFYHVSEYAIAWRYNRSTLSRDSWLFSKPYCVAMGAACAEYAGELALVPGLKRDPRLAPVRLAGLVAVVLGDGLRKAAEITARHNFTHRIQTARRPEHRVVSTASIASRATRATSGGSRECRHAGAPVQSVSLVGFAVASWRFFADRIPYEEAQLRRMFPGEYAEYAARTPTWIPGHPEPRRRSPA